MHAKIYLDFQAACRPYPKAVEAYSQHMETHFGSLLSPHDLGQGQIEAVNHNLHCLYDLFGAEGVDSFLYASSGAEAIAQVLYSTYFLDVQAGGKTTILTTPFEEAPTLLTCSDLKKLGVQHKTVPFNAEGQIDLKTFKKALTKEVSLVSLSWANALTGTLHPIEEIVELCKKAGVPLHLDVTAVLGKVHFYFNDLGATYITFDGGRVGAPKGIGGLFVREDAPFFELVRGKEPVHPPGLAALKIAVEETLTQFDHINLETMLLRDHFEADLLKACPEAKLFFQDAARLPNIAVVAFPGVDSEALMFTLQENGLYASFGGGLFPKLASLLEGCNIDPKWAYSALSFSLSHTTTKDEIEKAVELISDQVKAHRQISKAYAEEFV